MEQSTYQTETYFVRQALEGRDAYRSRRGKHIPAERALYLSVLRIIPENPVCVVQILHGIDERKERYLPWFPKRSFTLCRRNGMYKRPLMARFRRF